MHFPDLLHQLGLDGYGPHSAPPFKQTTATPGTVAPVGPGTPALSLVPSEESPDAAHQERLLQDQAGFQHLLDCLSDIISYNYYETFGPQTVGGKSQAALGQVANNTGVGSIYTIANPFGVDCEYCVIGAVFGAAGQAVLSKDPTQVGPALTAFYDSGSLLRGIPFFAAAAGTLTFGQAYWFPLQADDSLFWSVNMTTPNTNSALVTLAFRRRINRHGHFYLTME